MNKTFKIAFFSLLAFAIVFNACQKLIQYYAISEKKCTSCNKCTTVCGYGAISIDSVNHQEELVDGDETFYIDHPTTVRINPAKCVACGECFKNCPSKAISLVVNDDDGVNGTTGASRMRR